MSQDESVTDFVGRDREGARTLREELATMSTEERAELVRTSVLRAAESASDHGANERDPSEP